MTMAICIKCGAEKFGGFTPCQACGFRPVEVEDLARSLFLTDHHNKPDILLSIGRAIKDGTFTFDPDLIAPFVAVIGRDAAWLERIQHPERFGPSLFWRVLPWLFGCGVSVCIVASIWRLIAHW